MKKIKVLGAAISIAAVALAGAGYFFDLPQFFKKGKAPETAVAIKAKPQMEDEVSEEPAVVEISPDKQQLIGVKTAEAALMPMKKLIRTVGRIEYDERRLMTVNTKIEGWIEKLYVDYTGMYVKKGQPLAEIYSPELIATEEEFLIALRWAKGSGIADSPQSTGSMVVRDSNSLLEAAKQRLRLWDITDEQIKRIEDTGRALRTLTIYSPAAGYVIEKMVLEGMKVMPGERLFNVADISSLWVMADIYEYEMPLVKQGQDALITLSSLPGKTFFSRVDYVYPSVSSETRTVKVRLEVPNRNGQLKPQMFADVEIKIDLGRRLAIPEDSIIDTGTRQIVYVDKGGGYFEPREVMLGMKAEGAREVVSGLKAGDRVVSSATFLIDSEAQLKGITPLKGHKH